MKHLKSINELNKSNRLHFKNEVGVRENILNFFYGNQKVGYISYNYDGSSFSEFLDPDENEFYISMVEVLKDHRRRGFSYEMLQLTKDFAKDLGATIITLRVDHGMGYGSKRIKDDHLDNIYLKSGFKWNFTEEECRLDNAKELGAMYYRISDL